MPEDLEEHKGKIEEKDRRVDEALRVIFENIDGQSWGIVTQQGYRRLEKKIDDHTTDVENRLHRWLVVGLVAFALIGLSAAVAIAGFGVLLSEQGDLTNQIQQQRFNSFLQGCEDQNDRHDDVLKKIDDAVAKTPESEKAKAKKSAKPFTAILEAAVPYTPDCKAYAQDRVDGSGP